MNEKLANIRNFAIIAHVDAGKSTLADRFLELTHTIEDRKMREQFLDKMELEREKGITIKLQPIRMVWRPNHSQILNSKSETLNETQIQNPKSKKISLEFRDSNLEFANSEYILNMIDTPGHVDFSYEVSRSLAAVEGAVLLVDAKKGIQAQTIAHLEEAKKQDLVIIPVINKIDLSDIELERIVTEVKNYLQIKEDEIILISAKTGKGVENLLQKIVELIPPPSGEENKQARALIFDSFFDTYKGVVAYVRMVDGAIKNQDDIFFKQAEIESDVSDLGSIKADFISQDSLECGEIGYIITNLKQIAKVRVGDTVVLSKEAEKTDALPGYEEPKHFVYADFYTEEGDDYPKLREALEELAFSDASLSYEPIRGQKIMGRGFRCGFLGMLHLEIIKERLMREHNVNVFITPPSVNLKIRKGEGFIDLKDAFDFDNQTEIKEPYVSLEVIAPAKYMGLVMESLSRRRSAQKDTQFLSENSAILVYEVPLAEIIIDFYDELKSISKGYASMSYTFAVYRLSELARLDALLAGEIVAPFSKIVPRERLNIEAKSMAKRLKKLIPRQNFQVSIQIVCGGRVLAREDISAFRKDVIAKLYGGDRTRKDKLLKKQAKGKKRMKRFGKVDIPSDVFLKILKE